MLPDLELLIEVTRAFEEMGVAHAIGGSVASSAYGFYRTTHDADIVADLQPSHVKELERRLGSSFLFDEERVLSAISNRTQFNLIHLEKAFKVDVYLPRGDRFSRQQLTRRERIDAPGAPGVKLVFCSVEDLVLEKLRWFRMGGEVSERQWLDVQGVLKMQKPTIDRDYLRHWAQEIDVADLLDRAFVDAGYA